MVLSPGISQIQQRGQLAMKWKKSTRLWLWSALLTVIFIGVQCSMPTDTKETIWRTQITLPVDFTVYSLASQMKEGFKGFTVLGADDRAKPDDSLVLALHDTMDMNFDRHLFDLDSAYIKEKLGTSTIKNSTPVVAPMILNFIGTATSDTPFTDTSTQTLKNIYYSEFDSSCPLLPVAVTNVSGTVALDSLTVGIVDNGARVTSGFIATLAPGATDTAYMPIAGKALDSVIQVDASGLIRGNGAVVAATDGLVVEFSLDAMVVSKATILDSLLDFSHIYEKEMALSDTFNIDYIDFDTTIIAYTITTTAPITMQVEGELRDLWNSSFCKQNGIVKRANIAPKVTAQDSADPTHYRGKITTDTMSTTGALHQTGRLSFGTARLLAQWDTVTNRSLGYYQFTATIIPTGERVTISKDDRFEADLNPVKFPFVALNGTFQYAVVKTGEPFAVETALPFKSSITDSLRGNFQFISATAPLSITMNMADSSHIDSVEVSVTVTDPRANTASPCSSFIGIRKLTNNTRETATIDLTDLINGFPDSLIFSLRSAFPAGSRLFLTNAPDPVTGEYPNNLLLGAHTVAAARIPLDWKLANTAVVILEDSKVVLDSALKDVKILRDRELSLILRIENRSNLSGVLYAIAAADNFGKELLALPDSEVDPSICSTEDGQDFVNLLGNDGIGIPFSDTTDTIGSLITISDKSMISFDEPAIDKIFRATELHIRWKLVLPKKNAQVMRNSDKISISSSLHIQGNMTAHTLIDSLQSQK